MKNASKKSLKCILSIIFILIYVVFIAQTKTNAASDVDLNYLMEKYPDGKYWNHVGTYENNADGWTDTPCPHVLINGDEYDYYVGIGTCNSFGGDVQCVGFANKLVYEAYGMESYEQWPETTLDKLKPGDVVRFKYDMHTIFVTSVDGENITYAQCNGDYSDCKISWNVQITKSEIAESLTAVFSAPNALTVPLANHSSISTNEIELGSQINCEGIAEGGDENYNYEFSVLKPDTESYDIIQQYSDIQYFSYSPNDVGDYRLMIKVTDSTGQTENKEFDFTVTEKITAADIDIDEETIFVGSINSEYSVYSSFFLLFIFVFLKFFLFNII